MRFSKLCVAALALIGLASLGCSIPVEPSGPPPLTITPSVATLWTGESAAFIVTGGNGSFVYRVLVDRGGYFSDVSDCIGVLNEPWPGQIKFQLQPHNVGYCYQTRYTSGVLEVQSSGMRTTANLYFRY